MPNPPFRAAEMGPPLAWPCFEVHGCRPVPPAQAQPPPAMPQRTALASSLGGTHGSANPRPQREAAAVEAGRQGAVPAEHNAGVFPYNKFCTTENQPPRHACDQVHCLHPPHPWPPPLHRGCFAENTMGKAAFAKCFIMCQGTFIKHLIPNLALKQGGIQFCN